MVLILCLRFASRGCRFKFLRCGRGLYPGAGCDKRSKHVLRRYHLIREIIGKKDVKIERVPTDNNIADPFTKALSQKKHESHVNAFGLPFSHNPNSP